jgi:hypothetical protein
MTDGNELAVLRVSVARIAQVLGLDLNIPGATGRSGLGFQDLAALAVDEPRGWNTLCAMIVTEIQRRVKP